MSGFDEGIDVVDEDFLAFLYDRSGVDQAELDQKVSVGKGCDMSRGWDSSG